MDDFQECTVCAAKPGTPALCSSCLHNRNLINELQKSQTTIPNIELYVVQNADGQWFRRKGYGGYGPTWVDDFKRARIYNRIGGARAVITYFANQYPSYPIPQLIKLEVTKLTPIDETVRIKKAQEKREIAVLAREMFEQQHKLEQARKTYEKAKEDLEKLGLKV